MEPETKEIRQAHHRASVKWLLSKAFNNQVPDHLKEPYYRDHDNHERLKPQIIVELGNAVLYCQTLSNLYSDPNYQNLNHWSILQTLSRKGVPVAEIMETPITETVLIQTNPLRINAHVSVIESLMLLYVKEISSGDRICDAIKRISGWHNQVQQNQQIEHWLFEWINHAGIALKNRIRKNLENNATTENIPDIDSVQNFNDLSNGISLALLISYYCPKLLPWTSVRIEKPLSSDDMMQNLLLISNFTEKHLPYNVFHLSLKDFAFIHKGSLQLNIVALLAELFNLFEIHPSKCVHYPEMGAQEDIARRHNGTNEHGILHRRGVPLQPVTPIPDLRSELSFGSPTSRSPFQVTHSVRELTHISTPTNVELNNHESYTNEAFVVHKSRGVTTLSSMHVQQEPHQQEPLASARLRQSKEKYNMEVGAEEKVDSIPAGRPSNWEQNRRPSYAGRRSRRNSSSEDSQLTIENFGGSQEQLNMFGHFEREREWKAASVNTEPAIAVRSSTADARGTLQLGYDTDSGSEKQDCETEKYSQAVYDNVDNTVSVRSNTHHKHVESVDSAFPSPQKLQSRYVGNSSDSQLNSMDGKIITPRQLSQDAVSIKNIDSLVDDARSLENASKLSNIRMKLEEKRKRIEQEKRRIEIALLRHQETDAGQTNSDMLNWETLSNGSKNSTDIDTIDFEKYQQSIAVMNIYLQDIQQDIQRLAAQQSQIQAQHLQAQQLIQAHQIANILNQKQLHGSQQHLNDQYQYKSVQQPQDYGSTPHLPQALNAAASSYSSRPPSRGSFQQAQPVLMQCVNEFGQYMSPQHMSVLQQPCYMQPQTMFGDNNASQNSPQLVSHKYVGGSDICDDMHLGYNPESQVNLIGLHEKTTQPHLQRRTWANSPYDQQQQQLQQLADNNVNTGDGYYNYRKDAVRNSSGPQGFQFYHNGSGDEYQNQPLFQVHTAPQHMQPKTGLQRQQSMTDPRDHHPCNPSNITQRSYPVPISKPLEDVMAPQSICFIGDEEDVDEIERNIIESMQGMHISSFANQQKPQPDSGGSEESSSDMTIPNKINISSGSLTYRMPSPSRPSLHSNSFSDPRNDQVNEKGFYIAFDDVHPKRPKPPLRTKCASKKEVSAGNESNRKSLSQLYNSTGDLFYNNNTESNSDANSNLNNKNATYNKYSEPLLELQRMGTENRKQFSNEILFKENLKHQVSPSALSTNCEHAGNSNETKSKALVIGTDADNLDPTLSNEMERRKEKIILSSLQRRQQQEEAKARKEIEAAQKREREREKEEERARKKEEQTARRAAILEQHRLKKAMEEAERDGKTLDRSDLISKQNPQHTQNMSTLRFRQQKVMRPRPKTIHVDDGSIDLSEISSGSRSKKGSNSNLSGYGQFNSNTIKRDYYKGSQDSLTIKESPDEYPSSSSTPIGRRGSYKTSRDSGLGRATPPRRAASPGMMARHVPSPSGPGSLPPGLISKRRGFDDGSSDISLTQHSAMEYSGPKLYKQPAAKSNRGIILNAVEYCVFPGAVNREAKQRVLEKIARSEAKHFLVLFRDSGCQFRALYSFVPESTQVYKLYGTGPSQVDEVMFDKFFKYNSGGKCFSQVHTKHLTVTIDAFTIHNSLWQGKKVQLPNKKDMALAI